MTKRILITAFLLTGCAQAQAPSTADFSIKAGWNRSKVDTNPTGGAECQSVYTGTHISGTQPYTPPPTNSDSDNCDDNPNLSMCL